MDRKQMVIIGLGAGVAAVASVFVLKALGYEGSPAISGAVGGAVGGAVAGTIVGNKKK